MSWAMATVIIVALSFSIPLMKIWTNHVRRRDARRGADDGRVGSVEAALADLRERVETLERIATDERSRLEREFDHLERGRKRGEPR